MKKDALGEYCVTIVPAEMGCLKEGQQIGQIILKCFVGTWENVFCSIRDQGVDSHKCNGEGKS